MICYLWVVQNFLNKKRIQNESLFSITTELQFFVTKTYFVLVRGSILNFKSSYTTSSSAVFPLGSWELRIGH